MADAAFGLNAGVHLARAAHPFCAASCGTRPWCRLAEGVASFSDTGGMVRYGWAIGTSGDRSEHEPVPVRGRGPATCHCVPPPCSCRQSTRRRTDRTAQAPGHLNMFAQEPEEELAPMIPRAHLEGLTRALSRVRSNSAGGLRVAAHGRLAHLPRGSVRRRRIDIVAVRCGRFVWAIGPSSAAA